MTLKRSLLTAAALSLVAAVSAFADGHSPTITIATVNNGDMLTVRAIGDASLKHGDKIGLNTRANEIHRFDTAGLRME
jgi:hypothetical protein